MEKSIIRTESAGVHFGEIVRRDGKEVELKDAIRIWYWEGAFTLSQLAMEGTSKPEGCRFSVPVDSIILTEAIEIIKCSEESSRLIEGVTPCRK